MHVLVVTVVHRPDDARIRHRQISALLAAGHQVTFAAPWTGWCVPLPEPVPGLSTIDLPRASRRSRGAAALAARSLLAHADADLVLVHDPELVPWVRRRTPAVWDVHEDTAAALGMKTWLPRPVRGTAAGLVHRLEHWAEGRMHLLLAEDGYRDRFRTSHPVVPNSTPVPPVVAAPERPVAVYVGHLTQARGAADLIAVARRLREIGSPVHVEAIGHADAPTTALLSTEPAITWHGFLPNDQALSRVEGCTAGLSLLHDQPNYRHSRPTKVIEYMARGVPVVTTPTPPAQALIDRHGCGLVVPFLDPVAAADAVAALHADPARRRAMGAAGHAAALRDHDWTADAKAFVSALEGWSR